MTNSIEIKQLQLKYGNLEIFKNLNLNIKQKEFLVLLGPSGCGKSTLLNCIAGLLDIDDGQIFINGKNVTWEQPKDRGIGMVFQSYALYPQMSVKGNLSFALKNQRMPKADIEAKVKSASEILQIEHLLNRKPAALSGGQRQRVAIGRALVREVDVFLFDEPLSNLDAKLRTELRLELKRLHAQLQNTMVYVTHDQIEAMTLADRVVILNGGVIEQVDTPDTIYHKPKNLFVAKFIGSPKMNLFAGTIHIERQFAIDGLPKTTAQNVSAYEGDCPENTPVILGVRPEDITISDTKTADNTISATVSLVEPMGSENIIWLDLANSTSISVRTNNMEKYTVGMEVFVTLNMARVSLFDATTEQRL